METKEDNVKKKFSLPNEEVIVKFVPKKRGMAANVDDNHVISGGMLTNAVKSYMCPLQRSGGIANILSKEEKEYLEETLGLNLSVYGDFWTTFTVRLYKDSAANKFDLSDPIGFISVRILQQYIDEIAPRWSERHNKTTYMFAITKPGEEINENKIKLDSKKEAFKLYGKIEEDKETLLGVLKLLTNQPISRASELDWLQGKVQEYVDSNPTGFINVVKDPTLDIKLLINRAVELNIINKKGNSYITVDGLELCNAGEQPTFNNAVRFLNDDKNQEVFLMIQARIDNAQ